MTSIKRDRSQIIIDDQSMRRAFSFIFSAFSEPTFWTTISSNKRISPKRYFVKTFFA